MERDRDSQIKIFVLVATTALTTFIVSFAIFYGYEIFHPKYAIQFDSKNVSINAVNKFNEAKQTLEKSFYNKVDENALLEGAISGMADSLKDPYTVYYNKDQMKIFTDMQKKTEDEYVGIGVPVMLDDNGIVMISEPPFEDSPAQKVGLKMGDKIVKVGDKDVTGLKDDAAVVSLIKGKENTNVKITIYRPSEGKMIDFDITRKKIKAIKNLRSEIIEGNIGYIKIKMFDGEINHNFESNLDKLLEKGIKGLIIDVRDNPGGLYDEVAAIADRLLPKGTIVYTEDRAGTRQVQSSDSRELGLPIAILVNGNSASASEILAGAVKDFKKGTLIGTKTFGKGLVQVTYDFKDGTGLKVTIARYFTPSGVCIQGKGIQPDIEVKMDDKYKDLPASLVPEADDYQKKKAIEVIKDAIK